jgi:hypothetical protein
MGRIKRGMKVRKKLGRIPLPRKPGGPQTTKKGKRGYNRKREKERSFAPTLDSYRWEKN